MDVDPLGDTPPARHAIESDDEDEYSPAAPASAPPPPPTIAIHGAPPPPDRPLIVSSGPAAAFWARGAALGEQVASIAVDGSEVGALFAPAGASHAVLVSEARTRLPVWAMTPYATAALAALRPTSLTLLDTYPVPAYIGAAPGSSPVRVLANGRPAPSLPGAQPFAPPNLLQATAAAFLAARVPAALVLLPAPHIPSPPPRAVQHAAPATDAFWPTEMVAAVHAVLFDGKPPKPWHASDIPTRIQSTAAQRSTVGDGGMYI